MKKRVLPVLLVLYLCMTLLPAIPVYAAGEYVLEHGIIKDYNDPNGFVIKDGILEEYHGPGGDVVVPEGVIAIREPLQKHGIGVFQYSKTLTGISLPSSLMYISPSTFYRCEKLASVSFPNGNRLLEIGGNAFCECTSLKRIDLGQSFNSFYISDDGYEYQVYGMFQSLGGARSGLVPTFPVTIGSAAFISCAALEEVKLSPNACYTIGNHAFANCTSLSAFSLPDGNPACHENGKHSYIEAAAFINCSNLTSVTIADTVPELADGLCYNSSRENSCPKLTQVTKPASVSASAFRDTPWYNAQFANQGDFEVVDGKLTAYKGSDTRVVIPADRGITAIGKKAFDGKTQMVSVTIPEGVTEIQSAFGDCTALKEVIFPSTLKQIKQGAFAYTALERVTFPASLRYIGDMAFYSCDHLNHVVLPEGVVAEDDAFSNCKALTDVSIPNSALPICRWVDQEYPEPHRELWSPFEGTPFIETYLEAHQNDEFQRLGACLYGYGGAGGDVVIPEDIRLVLSGTFKNCSTITSLAYPENYYSRLLETLQDNPNSNVQFGFFRNVDFRGCTRLNTLNDPPYDTHTYSYEEEYKETLANNMAMYRLWANPADYVKPQSQTIQTRSDAIVSDAGARTDREKVKAICDWVAKNVKYDEDIRKNRKSVYEAVIDPETILSTGAPTTCDGYTRLTNALLNAQGIPAMFVGGIGDGEAHAWTEAFVDGYWLIADTTWMAPFVTDWDTGVERQEYSDKFFDPGIIYFSQAELGGDRHVIENRPHASEANTPSGWAQKEVMGALGEKLVLDDLQADYRSNITREEFCRLMVRLVERESGQSIDAFLATKGKTVTDPFTDTDTPEVLAAYALGIVNGTSATTFNPAGSITRQEAAAMLTRTAKLLGLAAGAAESFKDSGSVASWAVEGVSFVSGLTDPTTGGKVMGGTGGGNFSPLSTYTREQAILTALRLFHVK